MRSSSRGATSPTPSCCSCRGSSRRPSSSPAVSSWRLSRAGPSRDCSRGCGFDRLALRTGASEMLRVAEMPSAELLIAKIVFWIVWIGFIVSAVDTLQFEPFQGLVEEFFRFVPRFLVALLVLALGFLVGNFRLARDAARIGERRTARRAPAERHAAPAGDRDRGRHGARAAAAGDHRRADGVCDHVRRADARAWRSRSGSAAAMPPGTCSSSISRRKKGRDTDAAPHL